MENKQAKKCLAIAKQVKEEKERNKHLAEIKKIVNSKTYSALIYDLSFRVDYILSELIADNIPYDITDIIQYCLEQQKKLGSNMKYNLTSQYFGENLSPTLSFMEQK